MTTALMPVEFTPPLIAPANPLGLAAATTWIEVAEGEAQRWLPSGVQFRRGTYRDDVAFGVWEAAWNAAADDLDPEDDVKVGDRFADDDPDPFVALTVWASDRLQQCGNLTEFDRQQVLERLRQTFLLREPIEVETAFATRALADVGTPASATDIVAAVGRIEEAFTATGTTGLIHARPALLAVAEDRRMVIREPGTDPAAPAILRTPAGHRWVFGAGYPTPLGDTLIGTSATYGWREREVSVREATEVSNVDDFLALAERSSVVGFEKVIAAAEIP